MKLQRYITITLLTLLAFGCETPMLINPADVEKGIYVTLEIGNLNINSDDIAGTPIAGTFDNPSKNVASHDVFVKRIYDDGASESDYVLLETISSFSVYSERCSMSCRFRPLKPDCISSLPSTFVNKPSV